MNMAGAAGGLPSDLENDLVAELAQLVLAETAPEELAVFPDTAADYFEDPAGTLDPKQRDEAVGFGLELALLTPYVLSVGGLVIRYLASTVTEAAVSESKSYLAQLLRRMLHRRDPAAPAGDEVRLTPEQLRRVREIAYDGARNLRLGDDQARLLADAMVGGLSR